MLEARNICFSYPGSNKMLYQDFSLEVAPGERLALVAPSGFGKTSLCRILAGYEQPQEGEVLVDGQAIPRRGACPVQLIFQHPELALDPRMRMVDSLEEASGPFAGLRARLHAGDLLRDEVDMGRCDEAERLLRGLGIQRKWLSRYPHELSGGELQRFCVARALACNPRYLIADEISTMLDALTQAQIWTFLLEEIDRRGMGLVFVSHSPALTRRIATRQMVLSD